MFPVITPIIDSNLRYAHIEQSGFANDADALTWRNRIGLQSQPIHHLSGLIEFENVTALVSDYNSTTNGRTAYPTEPDPEVTELNRAQIMWTPDEHSTLTVGRQRIILDDARFVGNVGWRQDEQTFDGVRYDLKTGAFDLTAAYLSKINRVLAETRDWNSDSYLIHASYGFAYGIKLTGFDYALDFSNAAASSTQTYGARAAGGFTAGPVKFGLTGQYARQTDYRNNPADFDLAESMVEISAAYRIASFKINYESLGGNGLVGFITPLGTTHAFDGFSDAFSGTGGNKTTVNGLDDLNYAATFNLPLRHQPSITLIYHDLSTARLDTSLGHEWDAVATIALSPHLSLLAKYADFSASDSPLAPASRRKTWLALSFKL
ncbi:alginate export family protein [Asticcacaulis sp. EMRT-3]|uniref:alginate export family protein n=1 Tax=Asticcacaulis sp. EMRT-3 TaxID=3040349 RepID=UPI0024AF2784|nr:alginate export family protein [Asticcacaulis sp. EMRT-3]MDI7775720.1 alginate export family protein [Asticcacaulis sp. EMRT-3]